MEENIFSLIFIVVYLDFYICFKILDLFRWVLKVIMIFCKYFFLDFENIFEKGNLVDGVGMI